MQKWKLLHEIEDYERETKPWLKLHKQDVLAAAVLIAASHPRPRVGVLNASDADVIFGVNDFGEYWARGHKAGEEEYGMFTTGVLTGSMGFNPNAYSERRFVHVQTAAH